MHWKENDFVLKLCCVRCATIVSGKCAAAQCHKLAALCKQTQIWPYEAPTKFLECLMCFNTLFCSCDFVNLPSFWTFLHCSQMVCACSLFWPVLQTLKNLFLSSSSWIQTIWTNIWFWFWFWFCVNRWWTAWLKRKHGHANLEFCTNIAC